MLGASGFFLSTAGVAKGTCVIYTPYVIHPSLSEKERYQSEMGQCTSATAVESIHDESSDASTLHSELYAPSGLVVAESDRCVVHHTFGGVSREFIIPTIVVHRVQRIFNKTTLMREEKEQLANILIHRAERQIRKAQLHLTFSHTHPQKSELCPDGCLSQDRCSLRHYYEATFLLSSDDPYFHVSSNYHVGRQSGNEAEEDSMSIFDECRSVRSNDECNDSCCCQDPAKMSTRSECLRRDPAKSCSDSSLATPLLHCPLEDNFEVVWGISTTTLSHQKKMPKIVRFQC